MKDKVYKMENLDQYKHGYFQMVTAMLLMGTVGFFVVESGQGSYNVVFFRCLFGTICLGLYCYFRGFLKNTGLTRNTLFLTMLSGVFLVFNWVLLFASFETASIGVSTAVYHTQPLFFAAIGALVFRETITIGKIAWILLAFVGVILVSHVNLDSFSFDSNYFRGILYALCASMLWAITAIIVKKLKGIKPHVIAFIQVFVGIFALYPFLNTTLVLEITQVQWAYLFILGAVHTCITYILMYSAFQKLPTVIIAVLTFIYPAVAIFVDLIFYGEILSFSQILGAVLILICSFGISQSDYIKRKLLKTNH